MRWTLVALLLPLGAAATAGAAAGQRNQLSLEANPFHGTLGYARGAAPGMRFGVELGFGFPQADRLLVPDLPEEERIGDDFSVPLLVGAFVRLAPSRHVSLDAGARLGFADLRSCTASDCWPGVFGGASGALMLGWRHVKLGPRLTAGWIDEPGHPRTFVAALTPLAARVDLTW